MPQAVRQFLTPHLLLGIIVMGLYVYLFNTPPRVIFLHTLVLFCLYSLAFLLLGGHQSRYHKAHSLLLSLMTFTVLCTYLFNGLSNHFWGENVSAQFVLTYLVQLPEVLNEVSSGAYLIYALLAALWLGCFQYHRWHLHRLKTKTSGYRLNECALVVIICLIGAAYIGVSFDPKEPLFWQGEPLTHLVTRHEPSGHTELDRLQRDETPIQHNDRPNIILIHADALRADRMSAYGHSRETTPFLTSVLAEGGVRVENGFSICSESICGMLSALSGRGLTTPLSDKPLIHNLAKREGYRNYFIGTGNFAWEGVDRVLDTDLDAFIRADLDRSYSIHDDRIILDGIKHLPNNAQQPSLLFLRFMSSHPIGMHYNRYARYQPGSKTLLSFLFPSLEAEIAPNAHDNNALQLDDMVSKAMALLESKGYLNNYIAVLYGDHGDAFGEHGYHGHYQGLYQEEIGVPIIFWGSMNLDGLYTKSATLSDIVPTLVDIAGFKPYAGFEGRSLNQISAPRASFHTAKNGIYGLIKHRPESLFKLILDTRTGGKRQLFELDSDPQEQRDLSKEVDPGHLAKLEAKLRAHFNLP